MRTFRNMKQLLGALGLAGIAAAALAVFAERPAEAVAIPDLKLTKFGVESGLLTVLFAKELCSCHFVDGRWHNHESGGMVEATVVGWRMPRQKHVTTF